MRSQVGPATKELKTVADFDAFTSKDDVAVVGFLAVRAHFKSGK